MPGVPVTFNRATLSAITLTCCSVIIPNAQADRFQTWADVVDVEPVYSERLETMPVEHCRTYRNAERIERDPYLRRQYEDDDYPREGSPWRGLIGGLIGGLVGNQFGGGNGKTALTIAGAIAGASIARHSGRTHRSEPVRRCEVTYETRTVDDLLGYDVTYRYQGQEFMKRTDHHPGDRVRIDVQVQPAYASR